MQKLARTAENPYLLSVGGHFGIIDSLK